MLYLKTALLKKNADNVLWLFPKENVIIRSYYDKKKNDYISKVLF